MPVSVTSAVDGDIARITFSLDQGSSGARGVQLSAELNVDNASYRDAQLLVSGSNETSASEVNGRVIVGGETMLIGPVAAGQEFLTYEFDISGPGSIQITSLFVLTDDFSNPTNLNSLDEPADLITVTFGDADPLPQATEGPDLLTGRPLNESIFALGGDDTIIASAGVDSLDGGPGLDTVAMNGPQTAYSLIVGTGGLVLIDRREGGDETNELINIENLTFGGEAANEMLDLTKFGGAASLSTEDFLALTELYIAYYNRAPDAIGLNFWATAFANGLTLEAIALDFATQAETQAVYPDGTSNRDFVISVYGNVLGRDPDDLGLDFWEDQLNNNVGRNEFILRLLEGAKAPPPADAPQDFVDQQLADQSYLVEKSKAGAYYSVLNGMSDIDNASAVMAAFGDAASQDIRAAAEAADMAFETAELAEGGEFLMPIVGVLTNDFFVDFL